MKENPMKRVTVLVVLMAAGGVALSAQVVDRKALTLEGAKKVIAVAEAEAVKNRVGCNIAVVDEGGNLIAFHRVDPTFPAGARVSIGKARTAALFRQPTKNFEEVITQKGRTSMIALEDFTPLQGGVPIVVAGQIVGAIGVSGASSADQDQQFAEAGAAAIK
jgi:glc operon protein GlcG